MIDTQIIKALIHCSSGASREINCRPCPLYNTPHCIVKLCKGALNIIDTQQATIEDLKVALRTSKVKKIEGLRTDSDGKTI